MRRWFSLRSASSVGSSLLAAAVEVAVAAGVRSMPASKVTLQPARLNKVRTRNTTLRMPFSSMHTAAPPVYGLAGKRRVTTVPFPTRLRTAMEPPCWCAMARTSARPRPLPSTPGGLEPR